MDEITIPNGTIRLIPVKLLKSSNENNNDLQTKSAKRPCLELIKQLVQNEDLQVDDVKGALRKLQGQLDPPEIKAEPDVLEDSIEIVEHPLPDPDVIVVRDSDNDSNRSIKPLIRQKTLDSGLPSSISSYSTVCRDWLDSETSDDEPPTPPDPARQPFWTPPEIELGEIYFVPTDETREHWVKAQLVKYTSKSRLKLISLAGKTIKISWKYLALARRPESRVRVGGRVVAGFPQFDDAGELVRFRGYRMGVVGETPIVANGFRYLIIFDNGCWSYIQPDMVRPVFRSSKRVWKQVPQKYRKEVKQFLRGKFQPDRDLSRGQWVSVTSESSQLEGEQFSNVISVDCSLILVWYKTTRKPEWIHKGSPRIKLPTDF